ncbi:MAG TPA: A/G-specific adenine glycosylase, partial [Thermoanaerobaculia bacterium]|nr:A/G-specific adenine glycosylase [Thermoanaerobaculia bacterium]
MSAGARHDLVRSNLLAWFRRERRRLPWRGTRDPYRIWVSEVMLQQTTVEAVRGRYEAFLRRFPDLPALARAGEPAVLAAWSGLGYYARARNLRRAARDVMARHGGRLPRDLAALRSLPGFGDYTAAAVASLAFGARAPAADANVTRVLSRLYAIRGTAG